MSKYGVRVSSVHEIEVDDILQLRLRDSQHWSDFRVVWVGSEGADSAGGVGIEFIQAINFFGVRFPGEDWG